MVGVKTSLIVDDQLWKDFRKKCIDEEKSASEVIHQLMKEWLKK